jgi:ribonuclease P protein component
VIGGLADPPRVAYSVGRPVGGAVARNRLRRRLRVAMGAHADLLEPGHGYLVRADAAAAATDSAELSTTVRALLTQMRGQHR